MDEESEAQNHIYLRGFLSILPLIDADTLIAIGCDLKDEAERTRWTPTGRRVSNFGLILTSLGGVAVALFYIDEILKALQSVKVANIPIGSIGVYPLLITGVVSLAFIAKATMIQLQGMDDGTSPLAPGEESITTGIIEFVSGALFFGSFGLLLVQINTLEFLRFVALAAFIVGILVTAIGMTFSGTLHLGRRLIEVFHSESTQSEDTVGGENEN